MIRDHFLAAMAHVERYDHSGIVSKLAVNTLPGMGLALGWVPC